MTTMMSDMHEPVRDMTAALLHARRHGYADAIQDVQACLERWQNIVLNRMKLDPQYIPSATDFPAILNHEIGLLVARNVRPAKGGTT